MSNYPPDHCPYCGTELDPVDPPTAHHCRSCDRYVFHNPTPSARVLVLDGDRFLLVRQGPGPVEGKWLTPGGKVEVGNGPAEHAAVELDEETNLVVDPADLRLAEATAAEPIPDHHVVSVTYAVERGATSGTLEAGDDADAARWWTSGAFAAADQNGYPEQVEWVEERVAAARAALEGRHA